MPLESSLEQEPQFGLNELGRAFVDYGNLENVYGHWTAMIRERLGIAQASNQQAWPA